jgi:hypothetical protein
MATKLGQRMSLSAVFTSSVVDPDPHWKCGSGSRRAADPKNRKNEENSLAEFYLL